ncbi:MAG: Uma2 family endonuclease [Acidimicrobiales bacterium]
METLAPRLLTNADLDALDVPFLRELHEGVLYLSPSPGFRHQMAVSRLAAVFEPFVPQGFIGLVAPFDYQPDDHTTYEPDYSVWDRAVVERRPLDVPPLLAIEVLSPSKPEHDLVRKFSGYARSGVPHYWTLNPAGETLVAYRLHEGAYVEVGRAAGEELFEVEDPFPVRLRPAALFRSGSAI